MALKGKAKARPFLKLATSKQHILFDEGFARILLHIATTMKWFVKVIFSFGRTMALSEIR